MKFFTTAWWESGCKDPPSVIEKYQAYLMSIRGQLPAKLADFEDNYTLHDSRLKDTSCDFSNQRVVMVLDGWNQSLENQVCYTLTFSGVSQFHQQLPAQLHVESELGDLGYVELEPIGAKIEMKMLFASSAEFTITFSDFAFEHSAI